MNTKKTGNIIVYFIEQLGNLDHYKIGKLLYFLDSRFYMIHGRTITELEYAKLPYGPAPDNYELKFAHLENEQFINLKTKMGIFTPKNPKYEALKKSDLSVLDNEEIEVLKHIIAQYGKKSFDSLKDITHGEKPYNLPKYRIGEIFDFEDLIDTEEEFVNAMNDTNRKETTVDELLEKIHSYGN